MVRIHARESRLKKMRNKSRSWSVYIARCANGALYTGIARDLKSRIAAHNTGKGAKYTRSFGPVKLVWSGRRKTRSSALKFEARIRKLTRSQKLEFMQNAGKCRDLDNAEFARKNPLLSPFSKGG